MRPARGHTIGDALQSRVWVEYALYMICARDILSPLHTEESPPGIWRHCFADCVSPFTSGEVVILVPLWQMKEAIGDCRDVPLRPLICTSTLEHKLM